MKMEIKLDGGNYIALFALLLSLVSSGWVTYRYFVGPDVTLFGPSEVTFECYPKVVKPVEFDSKGKVIKKIKFCDPDSRVTLIAQMTYINKGDAQYNGVILRERADVDLPSKQITLTWQYFSNITTRGNTGEKVAAPELVAGRSSASHETRFFPKRRVCKTTEKNCKSDHDWYPWSKFIEEIFAHEKLKHIDIEFNAQVQEHSNQRKTWRCQVNFDSATRNRLKQRISREREALKKYKTGGEPVPFFVLPCAK